jgi:mannan endo-1,4-beta-mannosidase
MKKLITTAITLLSICCAIFTTHLFASTDNFVAVDGMHFKKSGKPYYIAGTNMWYAAYLGAPSKVGDRARLGKELDKLKKMGVNNLRVLAVSEKSEINSAVKPATTNGFGQYDENLLIGLDYLLIELAKRDMTVVLYLNNFWQWSGGMTQYMSWIDGQPVQDPNVTKDWNGFMAKSASFYQSEKAQTEFRRTIDKIVKRVNTINGKAYKDDSTIMSWQLANEPRPGNDKAGVEEKKIYVDWIKKTTDYIRSLDSKHLISTGSEGLWGSARDQKLFVDAHTLPNVDYLTYHMWVRNWSWFDQYKPKETWDSAWSKGKDYLNSHIDWANTMKKPIVLEEFGLDRDMGSYDIKAKTVYRDKFYQHVFDVLLPRMQKGEAIAGYNFWAWNGLARTDRANYWWQEGDDLMGDPPQEQQGMYGVFDTDKSTIKIIKTFNKNIHKLIK